MRKDAQVKVVNTDLSPKWRTSIPRRLTRSGVRRKRWSHRESHGLRRNSTQGETPQPQERPHAKDRYRHRRHGAKGRLCERDRQMRPMQIKAEDMRRTQQESVIKALRKIGQGLHQEGARDGMGERLRLGLKLRNTRETGIGPQKGKNTGESQELSKTCGRSEDHQETRRQLQGAKRSLRQRLEAHPVGSRAKHQ